MKIAVISEDNSLLAFFHEIARELPATSWTIERCRACSSTANSDLYFWDYGAGLALPQEVNWPTNSFVLVAQRDLESVRTTYPYAGSAVLLKPPMRAVISALMARAFECASQSREGIGAQSSCHEVLERLVATNLQLQQHDLDRANFLGRVLHDFQAPLTAIGGYCGLLAEEKIGLLNEQQKVIINRMNRSVSRLSRMSTAMFHLSVGRHVSLRPRIQNGDIRDCAEQALFEVQQLADEKRLQIDIDLEPPGQPLLVDSDQIEQVLINLLENACKFSPRFGSILVRGYSCFFERRATNVFKPVEVDRRVTPEGSPNVYRIDIQDSGPGIPPGQLTSIFEEYVSHSGKHEKSRAGLGLAICRMIVNQHSGHIWAANSQSGAIFSFVLPFDCLEKIPPPGINCEMASSELVGVRA